MKIPRTDDNDFGNIFATAPYSRETTGTKIYTDEFWDDQTFMITDGTSADQTDDFGTGPSDYV